MKIVFINSFYKFVKKISDKIPGDKIINTDWNGNNHHVVPGFDPTVGCNPKPDAAVFGSPLGRQGSPVHCTRVHKYRKK